MNTNATANGHARGSNARGGGAVDGRTHIAHYTTAPRRVFLCDVPLLTRQTGADRNGNTLVRLMGTVVDIIETSASSTQSVGTDRGNLCNNESSMQSTYHTPATAGDVSSATPLSHFVIDDGTASIGVVANRRVERGCGCNGGTSSGNNVLPASTARPKPSTIQKATQNQFLQIAHPQTTAVTLESILSTPPPPISVGQTVDCIGCIRVDPNYDSDTDEASNDIRKVALPSSHRIWLAASSVSIVKNPQAVTLRQLELSSSRKWISNSHGEDRNRHAGGSNNPKNRILVGGELEGKLNPLYHCSRQRSVIFQMDKAFQYIKHSKDDGGITQQELALLVGAVEASEVLAVNLTVQQLREECRIYQNHQGKWFPM